MGSQRSSMSCSTQMIVSLEVAGVLFGVLFLRKQSSQQAVSLPLRIIQSGIQTGLTLCRKSKFLRATPSGFASLTLIVNLYMITSLSEIMMALYSEHTLLMLNSILMEVSHKGVGGLNGEWSMMRACQRV